MSTLQFFLLFFNFIIVSNADLQNVTRTKRIVGGVYAAIPPEDDPVVYVARGKRYAEIYGERDPDGGFYVFKGIRYGMPTYGENRFQRPKEMPLNGELRALKYGPPCPQLNEENELIGDEDCLFLNIITPNLPYTEDKKLPVLIWIHGGGFRRGSASQYGMENLVKKDMIVVSIQYRLGTLGFISSGTPDLPGNNGIFDMMLAVQWVRKHIEFFGGDVTKINVGGHETGASAAQTIGLSKIMNRNINGIISMSGSALSNFAVDKDPAYTCNCIAKANNCTTENVIEMVKCLRKVPVEQLVKTDVEIDNNQRSKGLINSLTTVVGARPVVEGLDDMRALPHFTTDSATNSLSQRNIPDVPMLMGVANNQAQGAVLGDHKQELLDLLLKDPSFIENYLVPKLQKNIPVFPNLTKYFTPAAFSKYFKLGKSQDSLGSIKDAVEDALFNVPAYLAAKYWSKKANTTFFVFDHAGKLRAGSSFLAGSAIISKNPPPGTVNFGDDLGYVFGQNTIFGEKMQSQPMDQDDKQVMESYTDMIAQFARSGDYQMKDQSGGRTGNAIFSETENNYVSMGKVPQIKKGFRFCEIGLWMGLAQILQNNACSFLKTTLETVTNVIDTPTKVIDNVDLGFDKGVLDGIQTLPIGNENQQPIRTRNPTTLDPRITQRPLQTFGQLFG